MTDTTTAPHDQADPDPPALVKLLLHSHPTVAERIRMARAQTPRPPGEGKG